MCDMTGDGGLTELRRGVLGPCVLALLELRPRFGLELVRDLAAADGLLTSDGTVYPLLNRLRDMADPEATGVVRGFHGGSVAAAGPAVPEGPAPDPKPSDRVLYQNRVAPFMQNSVDVTSQAALSADRRYVRVSLGAVFTNVSAARPAVNNPAVPGAVP